MLAAVYRVSFDRVCEVGVDANTIFPDVVKPERSFSFESTTSRASSETDCDEDTVERTVVGSKLQRALDSAIAQCCPSHLHETTRARNTAYEVGVASVNEGVMQVPLAASIGGFRIVRSANDHFAEFLIVAVHGDKEWASWHRFSEITTLASAVLKTDGADDASVEAVAAAWKAAQRPAAWWMFWRSLNTAYLERRCLRLERFVLCLLRTAAGPGALLNFLGASAALAAPAYDGAALPRPGPMASLAAPSRPLLRGSAAACAADGRASANLGAMHGRSVGEDRVALAERHAAEALAAKAEEAAAASMAVAAAAITAEATAARAAVDQKEEVEEDEYGWFADDGDDSEDEREEEGWDASSSSSSSSGGGSSSSGDESSSSSGGTTCCVGMRSATPSFQAFVESALAAEEAACSAAQKNCGGEEAELPQKRRQPHVTSSKTFWTRPSRQAAMAEATPFTWTVADFRVMEEEGIGRNYAQYLVVAQFGKARWTRWVRWSEFERFAEALKACRRPYTSRYGGGGGGGGGGLWGSSGSRSGGGSAATVTWDSLAHSTARPWRCLDEGYLRFRCSNLAVFLQRALYGAANASLMVRFLDGEF